MQYTEKPQRVFDFNPHELTYKGCEIDLTTQAGNPVFTVFVRTPDGIGHSLPCVDSGDYDRALDSAVDFIDEYHEAALEHERLEHERLAA